MGMVLMPEFNFDRIFRDWEARKRANETVKLWENFVCQGNFDNTFVRIPSSWVPFFSSLLLSADNFGWTKEFLASGALGFLAEYTSNFSMPLPKSCPTIPKALCISEITNSADAEGLGEKGKVGEATRGKALRTSNPIPQEVLG